jgi:hypothetical protein
MSQQEWHKWGFQSMLDETGVYVYCTVAEARVELETRNPLPGRCLLPGRRRPAQTLTGIALKSTF